MKFRQLHIAIDKYVFISHTQDSSSTVNYNSNGQDQEMQVVMSQGGTSYVLSQGGTSYTSLTKQFMTGSLVGNYAQQNYEDFLSTDTTCSFMDLLNQPLQTEVLTCPLNID